MLSRVSSATEKLLGVNESREKRERDAITRRGANRSRVRKHFKTNNSVPISVERRMPGHKEYDGFTMKKRMAKGRKTKQRRGKRRRKRRRTRKN